MIKQKVIEFFIWIKDHFRFLVEVVVRLSLGIEKKDGSSDEKEDYYDK